MDTVLDTRHEVPSQKYRVGQFLHDNPDSGQDMKENDLSTVMVRFLSPVFLLAYDKGGNFAIIAAIRVVCFPQTKYRSLE